METRRVSVLLSSVGRIAPGRLWSLWEMLGKYASAYIVMVEAIDSIIQDLDKLAADRPIGGDGPEMVSLAMLGKEAALSKGAGGQINGALGTIAKHLATRTPFPSVTAQVRRIEKA